MNEHEDEPVPGLRALPTNRQPERDLWPSVAARIAAPRRRWHRPFLAAAACAVLALGAMLSLRMSETTPLKPVVVASAPAALQSVRRITDLRADRALIKANLRLTRSAESQLRKALRQSPGDKSLKSLLSSTREQGQELNQLLLADRN